jgi:hypothetical protein
MNHTCRAAYYENPKTGQQTVLTGPEHAHLDDDALFAEAIAEAERANIVDMDETDPDAAWPRLTGRQLRAGLAIGELAA